MRLALVSAALALAAAAGAAQVDWTHNTGSLSPNALAGTATAAYVTQPQKLYTLDPSTGTVTGAMAPPHPLEFAGQAVPIPAFPGRAVIPLGLGGVIASVEVATNTVVWSTALSDHVVQFPALRGLTCAGITLQQAGLNMVGVCQNSNPNKDDLVLVALSVTTGAVAWARNLGPVFLQSVGPVVDPAKGTVVVADARNGVVTAFGTGGQQLWNRTIMTPMPTGSTPLLVCSGVVLVFCENALYALSVASGGPAWVSHLAAPTGNTNGKACVVPPSGGPFAVYLHNAGRWGGVVMTRVELTGQVQWKTVLGYGARTWAMTGAHGVLTDSAGRRAFALIGTPQPSTLTNAFTAVPVDLQDGVVGRNVTLPKIQYAQVRPYAMALPATLNTTRLVVGAADQYDGTVFSLRL